VCSGQIRLYKIGICCFSVNHAALRSKSKDWMSWNHCGMSQHQRHHYQNIIEDPTMKNKLLWTMYLCTLNYTIKIQLSILVLLKADILVLLKADILVLLKVDILVLLKVFYTVGFDPARARTHNIKSTYLNIFFNQIL
jgi:hypothetical protein